MDPATAAVIASVGSSAVSTGGGLLGQIAANRANRKLAEYAYSKDLEMWNRQNEYNLPINQMARLEQAGLNPNMMYGTGQGANVAKEMPRYNAPTMSYDVNIPNMLGTISAFQDIKIKQKQAENIEAQTQTRILENKLREGTLESAIKKAFNQANISVSDNILKAIQTDIELALSGIDSTGERTGRFTQVEQAKAQLGISQATAERAMSEAQLKKIELGIFKALEKMGTSSDTAATITRLLQMLILRK